MIRFLRLASLVLVLLLGPLAALWILAQGMTHLYWGLFGIVPAWLALLALWYGLCGAPPLRRRLARICAGLAVALVLGGIAVLLLRYEGSASGTSLPRFAWVWQPSATDAAPAPDAAPQRTELAAEAARLRDAAGESPQFLGADGGGARADLPFGTDWSADPPQLVWRRPVGRGWSSFAVAGGRAVTQMQDGADERVLCLDLFTGEELWSHADEGVRLLEVRAENAGAAMGGDGPRATPSISGGRVYATGSTGILNCLDFATGERLWSLDLMEEFDAELPKWGAAGSPLPLPRAGVVVVPVGERPAGGGEGTVLAALDLESGETVWTHRGAGASYSTPRLLEFFGRAQIVSVNARDITGVDPADGALLWRHPWPGHAPKVGQPARVGEDRLLLTASYGMGSPMIRLSAEGGGDSGPGQWRTEELWRTLRLKTKFSSAVVHEGHAYGLDEGRLACIELEGGELVWKERKRHGFGQQLLFGGWLLIQTEPGAVVLGRASPEGFEEAGRVEALDSMTWNAPVVAGRLLLVRNDREAACYLLPPPQ